MAYRIDCSTCKDYGDVETTDEVARFHGAHPHPIGAEWYPQIAMPVNSVERGEF